MIRGEFDWYISVTIISWTVDLFQIVCQWKICHCTGSGILPQIYVRDFFCSGKIQHFYETSGSFVSTSLSNFMDEKGFEAELHFLKWIIFEEIWSAEVMDLLGLINKGIDENSKIRFVTYIVLMTIKYPFPHTKFYFLVITYFSE